MRPESSDCGLGEAFTCSLASAPLRGSSREALDGPPQPPSRHSLQAVAASVVPRVLQAWFAPPGAACCGDGGCRETPTLTMKPASAHSVDTISGSCELTPVAVVSDGTPELIRAIEESWPDAEREPGLGITSSEITGPRGDGSDYAARRKGSRPLSCVGIVAPAQSPNGLRRAQQAYRADESRTEKEHRYADGRAGRLNKAIQRRTEVAATPRS